MAAKSVIQVIDRMSGLLDAVARYPEPVSLKILAAETGLHSSTAYRILDSMEANGFIERDAGGKYQLGRKLLRLGSRVHATSDLRQLALPVMQQLRDALGETINLTLREGDEVVYVEKATPNRMMHVQQLIGSRAPLHVTAVGKLMLAVRKSAVVMPCVPICPPIPATRSTTCPSCCRKPNACGPRAMPMMTKRRRSVSAALAP